MQRSKRTSLKFKPRQTLFWDVNPKTIDPHKHAKYVIERILEFGKDDEVRWMVHYYSPRQIKKVVQTSRGVLHDKTKALWQLIYP
ncbi:MAG TPA: hypothetical protein DEG44_02885 [Candidatus Kerfeldbacteria bacterium]|nr:hypothetical protein [Candidatus Kerfeldbacteria bacterium]